MANLGKLTITIEQIGADQVTVKLRNLENQVKSTNNTINQSNSSTQKLGASLNQFSRDASSAFGNAKISVNGTNKVFLDLIQTMLLLGKTSNLSSMKNLGAGFKALFNSDYIKSFVVNTTGARTELKKLADLVKDDRQAKVFKNPVYATYANNPGKELTKFGVVGKDQQPPKININAQQAVYSGLGAAVRESMFAVSKQQAIVKLLGNLRDVMNNPAMKVAFPATIQRAGLNMFAATSTKGSLMAMATGFGALIKEAYTFAAVALSVVVPALIAIGKHASDAAKEMESMQARFTAVKLGELIGGTGVVTAAAQAKATQSAKEMLDYVKQLAIPSTFTAQQLFKSAQQMESFGLNSKRSLFIAAQLAEVFGGTEEELLMITRMMGRMAAGELPDARALGRFGMNKEMLFGGKSDELTGEELLSKFAEFIRKRYSTIYDQLGNTAESKLATLQEKFQFGMAKIGEPINKALGPIINKLIDFIDKLERSGVLEEFGKSIGDMLTKMSSPEVFDGLVQIFFDIGGAIQAVAFEVDKLLKQFVGVYYVMSNILKLVVAVRTFGLSLLAQQAIPDFMQLGKGLGMILNPQNYINMPGFIGGNAFEQSNKLKSQFDRMQSSTSSKVSEPAGAFISDMAKVASETEKQSDKLDKIKDNTKNTADELSLRKAAMGGRGGPLNQLGMSPTQVAFAGNVNMDRSAFQDPTLMNPFSMLEKAIVDIVRRNDSKTFRRF